MSMDQLCSNTIEDCCSEETVCYNTLTAATLRNASWTDRNNHRKHIVFVYSIILLGPLKASCLMTLETKLLIYERKHGQICPPRNERTIFCRMQTNTTLPKHASQLINQPLKQKSYALPYQISMYVSLKQCLIFSSNPRAAWLIISTQKFSMH